MRVLASSQFLSEQGSALSRRAAPFLVSPRSRRRFARLSRVSCNADASGSWLLAHGALTPAARDVVTAAMETLRLSARGFHRVLRIGRTIADLDESELVEGRHAAEALRYRPRTT